jgi:hypothetical protein
MGDRLRANSSPISSKELDLAEFRPHALSVDQHKTLSSNDLAKDQHKKKKFFNIWHLKFISPFSSKKDKTHKMEQQPQPILEDKEMDSPVEEKQEEDIEAKLPQLSEFPSFDMANLDPVFESRSRSPSTDSLGKSKKAMKEGTFSATMRKLTSHKSPKNKSHDFILKEPLQKPRNSVLRDAKILQEKIEQIEAERRTMELLRRKLRETEASQTQLIRKFQNIEKQNETLQQQLLIYTSQLNLAKEEIVSLRVNLIDSNKKKTVLPTRQSPSCDTPPPSVSTHSFINTPIVSPPPPPSVPAPPVPAPPPAPPINGAEIPQAPEAPPIAGQAFGSTRGALNVPVIFRMRSKKNLKVLHWDKINVRETLNTIWEHIQFDEKECIENLPTEYLEELFEDKKVSKKGEDGSDEPSSPKKGKAVVIAPKYVTDPKAKFAVDLLLGKLKIDVDDIVELIMQMDESTLRVQQLTQILQYIPSDTEVVSSLRTFNGDVRTLAPVDRLYHRLVCIGGMKERLELWIFKQNFTEEFSDDLEKMQYVNATLEYLRESTAIRDIFSAILNIGNYLNQSHAKGNAWGFRIRDTLPKLKLMKSTILENSKDEDAPVLIKGSVRPNNLMEFLLAYLSLKHPTALKFIQDAEIIRKAGKVEQSSFLGSVSKLYTEFRRFPSFLKAITDDEDTVLPEVPFSEKMKRFHRLDRSNEIFTDFYTNNHNVVDALYQQASEAIGQVESLSLFYGEKEPPRAWEEFFQIFVEFADMMKACLSDMQKRKEAISKKQKKTKISAKKVVANRIASPDVEHLASVAEKMRVFTPEQLELKTAPLAIITENASDKRKRESERPTAKKKEKEKKIKEKDKSKPRSLLSRK